jgi:hypothetical protein
MHFAATEVKWIEGIASGYSGTRVDVSYAPSLKWLFPLRKNLRYAPTMGTITLVPL